MRQEVGVMTSPDSTSNVNAAARVEKIYNSFPAGTDADGNAGYNAGKAAEEQLRQDFLGSFGNPQLWQFEVSQLNSDSLKYGGDKTLDAAAMYWAESHLLLPAGSPDEITGQAQNMDAGGQPGEREFDEFMANYVAQRFYELNGLTPYFQSVDDQLNGKPKPVKLSDIQMELNSDEVDRTEAMQKPSLPWYQDLLPWNW